MFTENEINQGIRTEAPRSPRYKRKRRTLSLEEPPIRQYVVLMIESFQISRISALESCKNVQVLEININSMHLWGFCHF